MELPLLNLPPVSVKTRNNGLLTEIWDFSRSRWLVLTPEEWVRQHIYQYLTEHLSYPAGRIETERIVGIPGLRRRFDLLVRDASLQPVVLAEFKSPHVEISQETFIQAAHYNTRLKVPYLLISNGLRHFFCRINFENRSWEFVNSVLPYGEL